MQERPTGKNLPVYAALSTMRQEPSQSEMNNGVIPLDTLPAAWWNWMWNAITQAQNDSMYNDDVLFTEINNVLTAAGITPGTSAQHDQLRQAIMVIKDTIATTAAAGSVLSTDDGTTGTIKVAADGKMTVNNFGDIASFHGATKDNLVGALNETYDIAYGNKDNAGELTTLSTNAKDTLVDAINELDAGKAPTAHASTATTYGVGSATNYGHVKLTDTPGSDDASSGIAATPKLVQDVVSGGMGAVNAVMYTYVVDSNQKLADWANNVTTDGQDYTSVLIRKGTWTSDKGIYLTDTGTKAVVGEIGNKIIFNIADAVRAPDGYTGYYALHYNLNDYFAGEVYDSSMQGLNIEVVLPDKAVYMSHGVINAVCNITDCTLKVLPVENTTNSNVIFGFGYCKNLNNCRCTITNTSSNTFQARAYAICQNLQNCIGITKCHYTGSSSGSGSVAMAFSQCTRLTACGGQGLGTADNSASIRPKESVAFHECVGVSRCYASAQCGDVYHNCYASNAKTSAYACADTANGGFNNATNPSA